MAINLVTNKLYVADFDANRVTVIDGNVVGCTLAKVMQTTPSLTAQLSDALTPGVDYCANIADVGGLRESANFSIRISHP